VVTRLMVPYILLYALYVQFHGDYGPGGGFQAGVIFSVAVILYSLVFDLDAARRAVPPRAVYVLIPAGLLLYVGTGIAALLLGGEFLDYGTLDDHDPVHGQHLGILLVELGVGITVSAVMLSIYYSFAELVEA
jgi:multicomponent Na+:H+ antiporter subunit B